MKKALVITVGTGIGKYQESLAHGITYSIRTHNPTKVLFLVTEESKTTVLLKVLEKADLKEKSYEIHQIKDMNDIESVYRETVSLLKHLIEKEKFTQKDIVHVFYLMYLI
jgi:hypothetical protein